MRKLFTLAITLVMALSAFAQTAQLAVSESPEFKDKEKAGGVLAIYTNKESITALIRESKRHILFDVFDSSLNKTHSSLIETDKREFFKDYVTYGDEIKVFTLYSPSKKERVINCHTFNVKTKKHSKTQLLSKTITKRFPIFSGGRKRETSFAISPNGQYIAMATDDIKKNSNAYSIHVFDTDDLSLVYSKSYKDEENKYFEFNDLAINNDAITYSLGKLYKTSDYDKVNGKANYDFIIYKIIEDNVQATDIILKGEQFIRSLSISQNDTNLQLTGFYSERNSSRIKGGCTFTVNSESLSIEKSNHFELPKQVYYDLYSESAAKRKKTKGKELSNFYTDYIIEDEGGNTYLVAEEFYITTNYVPNGMGGGYMQTIPHYDDILIMKINKAGNLDWGRSIFKRSGAPSYNVFLKDDKLHVLLNSGKNLIEKEDGRTKVSKGWFESTSLYDIVFDKYGDSSYNKVQDNKGNTHYIPYFGTFNNGTFIMTSAGRKKKQFMILK
ncbi:hypothetical protein [Winogradskyella jejuensis]|uniref:Uncharacterized protein n=1 Tax=Winogradskyella jejuensis TaxID=1089305 RepID=A0A1M5TLT5_9FLAO|nr:hypothetical protein [Winogradskyella jejuensis]SHH51717.1 hypothetical protein SAMN05444148_2210 [Winogradskyella jejuensis]